MAVLRRVGPLGVPVIVWAFFAIDVALGTIYVVDHLLGTPFATVTRMFDLDGESNVPTWYSSIQWFVVFAVLFGVAERRVSLADRRSWFLCLLPLVFLAMSADEVVQLHERIGATSDGLLFGESRAGTALPETGIWFIVVGVPFVVAIIALFATIRPYLRRPSGGARAHRRRARSAGERGDRRRLRGELPRSGFAGGDPGDPGRGDA